MENLEEVTIENLTSALHEARTALAKIRDTYVPALRRDASEPDKTLCHAGGIAYECAKVVPEYRFKKVV